MTLTILVSVSLLALVSSARPLPLTETEDDAWKSLQVPGSGEDVDIQQVVHAVVKSHASLPEDLKEEVDVHVQLASSEEVQAYLSNADSNAIKALVHLDHDELHSPDEKELYELLNRLEEERVGSGAERSATPVSDDALDSMHADLTATSSDAELETEELSLVADSTTSVRDGEDDVDMDMDMSSNIPKEPESFAPGSSSTPIIIMAISCGVALLVVTFVSATLFIAEIVKKSIFHSTWALLPQLEKNFVSSKRRMEGGGEGKRGLLCAAAVVREAIQGGFGLEKKAGLSMRSALIAGAAATTTTTGPSLIAPTLPKSIDISKASPLRQLLPFLIPRTTSRASLLETGTEVDTTTCNNNGSDSGKEADDAESRSLDSDSDASLDDLTKERTGTPSPVSAPAEQRPSPPGLPTLVAAAAAAAAVTVAAIAHANTPNPSEVGPLNPRLNVPPRVRPEWSIRAKEASALIHAHDNTKEREQEQGQGQDERLQVDDGFAYGTHAAPELDAALAMQLRPGLGIGADAAWLVRFVMVLFGWCAVLMSGRRWRR